MNAGLSPEARAPYALRFSEIVHSPSWLAAARQSAFDAFLAQGWPNKKQEEWRFTDISPITELEVLPGPGPAPGAPSISPSLFDRQLLELGAATGHHRLVFVDGRLEPAHGTAAAAAPGLRVLRLTSPEAGEAAALRAHFGCHLQGRNAFAALNTAFVADGAFVEIPRGLHCEQPIIIVYLAATAGSTSFPRTLIVAGAGSHANVVEVYLGADGRATLSNAATEIVLEEDAQLDYQSVQQSSAQGFHIGHVAVTQGAGSRFSAHSLALRGRILRHDIHVALAGESCTCNLDGVYLASGQGHVDNQTTIDHCVPRSTSRERYRGAVAGKGHAVFSGRIIVRPGAEKTDARQTNRNLLLSDSAQINSKPQLEIFTSDVKCSHGATTGRLDPDALFYLRARGIGEQDANRMLIRAFLHQGLEDIASPDLRGELEAVLDRRIDDLVAEGRQGC